MQILTKIRVWLGGVLGFFIGRRAPQLESPTVKVVAAAPAHTEASVEFGVPQALQEVVQEPWLKSEYILEMQRFVLTQRSEHTKRAYKSDLDQFRGYLLAERQRGDSFDALLAYRDWLTKPKIAGGAGLTRASANRKFATIRSFLAWLQARGKTQENPSLWVKNYRAKTESPTQAFTDLEVAEMLSIPNERTPSGLMHSVILHLLFFLGLRRGELAQLQAKHLGWIRNGDHKVLTLRIPGKGDKERLLPMPKKVEDLLLRYLEKKRLEIGQEGYLFTPVKNNVTKQKEKPIATQAVYYIVKKYAQRAGVDRRVSPHSCRATAISNALDHAASHRAVQEMAGWSSPLMIERYDKRRTALQDSAVHLVDY
jgi:integrase/recombinase XerD